MDSLISYPILIRLFSHQIINSLTVCVDCIDIVITMASSSSSSAPFVDAHLGGYESEDIDTHIVNGTEPSSSSSGQQKPRPNARQSYRGAVPGGKFDVSNKYDSYRGAGLAAISASEWRGLDAYSRHMKYIHDYVKYFGGSADDLKFKPPPGVTDHDVLRQQYKYVCVCHGHIADQFQINILTC
jgi:hypothetical protein